MLKYNVFILHNNTYCVNIKLIIPRIKNSCVRMSLRCRDSLILTPDQKSGPEPKIRTNAFGMRFFTISPNFTKFGKIMKNHIFGIWRRFRNSHRKLLVWKGQKNATFAKNPNNFLARRGDRVWSGPTTGAGLNPAV